MEKPSSHQEQEEEREQKQQELKLCLPLVKLRTHDNLNPFSILGFWVSKSLRNLSCRARFSNGDLWRRFLCSGYLLKSSVFCGSSVFLQEGEVGMESFVEKCEGMEFRKDGFDANGGESESFADAIEDVSKISDVTEDEEKPQLNDRELEKQGSNISEIEMMKERFSKLLLGEDMSGCGRGVCTALAISNAITNLYATLFGQLWRLEPLAPEKKSMWRREMEWVLCVSDHIVELIPCWQTFPDGGKLEVMTCRPRSDLYINLPALRKLDTMLLDILDSFSNTEFWYVDQGILAPDADGSASFHRPLQRQEEKWWLPVPRLPPGGLLENSRKQLQHRRECTNQILKAAMAINSIALAEMEVPQPYLEALPKSGKISLGEVIYQYIMSDHFSPECLLDCLDLSSEHHALDIANRAEASINVWCQRTNSKPLTNTNHSTSKSSWEMVKELMMDADKRELLADRSKSLLVCLKERFPGLPQTTLDMCKIQYNKDVGKSIIESYSRVLESMAFNIVARIDDLLYVDDLSKHSDQFTSVPSVSVIAHKKLSIPYSVPILSTPCRTAFTIPSFSPASLVSPTRGERSPFLNSGKPRHRGFGVKKVLTNYLGLETKRKNCGNPNESDSIPNKIRDAPASATGTRDLVAAG